MHNQILYSFVIQLLFSSSKSYDVLMVIGGMSIENGMRNTHRSVEIIGVNRVCRAPPIPFPRQAASAAKLNDRVIICGGNDGLSERSECFHYLPATNRWVQGEPLPSLTNVPNSTFRGVIFGAAAGGPGGNYYYAGGRSYNHETREWDYLSSAWKYNSISNNWIQLQSLKNATADSCLVSYNNDLFLIGGSRSWYRYADEPSKVWVLFNENRGSQSWRDDIIPPLMGSRMWHGCTIATLNRKIGILVAGGYSEGRFTMFYPFNPDYVRGAVNINRRSITLGTSEGWVASGWLPDDRKYGPGLGLVAGVPTIAGGAEYGDEIIDEMVTSSSWSRRQGRFIRGQGRIGHTLRYKREYGAYATVPHFWFPWCRF